MGKAVVSTTVGAEGLAVTPGRDIAIADQPDRFADVVVALLRNPARREALGRAGRLLVQRRYSWEQVSREFDVCCESVARIRHARSGTPLALATRQSSS
jgi:glycosyltransferase involved in cell wall biosynthesis